MYMEFSEWITERYLEWRGKSIGNEKSISQFAEEYIGVSQPLMIQWMQGTKKPGTRTIPKIADRYPEIYKVLGLESQYSLNADQLPSEIREHLQSALNEINDTIKAGNVSPDSPEGFKIASDIFDKFGFSITDTE